MTPLLRTIRVAYFIRELMPDLRELAKKLFDQTEGDLFRAREALKLIGNHGEKLKAWEAETRQRLDEAKARAKAREQGGGST